MPKTTSIKAQCECSEAGYGSGGVELPLDSLGGIPMWLSESFHILFEGLVSGPINVRGISDAIIILVPGQ